MTITVHPGMYIDTTGTDKIPRGNPGTLGFLASPVDKPLADGPQYLVSNAHVLANPLFQPKIDDHVIAQTGELIAKLKAWTPLTQENSILIADVAIAELEAGLNYGTDLPIIGPITGVSHHLATGLDIYTYGAKTKSKQISTIISLNNSEVADIPFLGPNKTSGKFRLTDLIACEDYGQKGDSGSPILNRWGRIIGIHAAERLSTNQSLFIRIQAVLQALTYRIGHPLKVWHSDQHDVDLRHPDRVRIIPSKPSIGDATDE